MKGGAEHTVMALGAWKAIFSSGATQGRKTPRSIQDCKIDVTIQPELDVRIISPWDIVGRRKKID